MPARMSSKRGTYAGLIEKIPYLEDLGVTAVDAYAPIELSRHGALAGRPSRKDTMLTTKTVVNRPVEEVYDFWRNSCATPRRRARWARPSPP